MTADLTHRVAIITGAARGIGQTIAAALREAGARVVLGDVNGDDAQRTARQLDPESETAIGVAVDVRSEASIEALFGAACDTFGRVGILVNNASRTSKTPLWDITCEEWNDVIATNLRGTFFGCRVGGAHMRADGGRLINMASLAGQWGRSATGAHYAASKAGIIGLTRVFAHELAPTGVTVNALAPAMIDSPQVRNAPPEGVARAVAANIPVGRLGLQREVAAAAVFLASEDAAFITGATVDVNGGALMR